MKDLIERLEGLAGPNFEIEQEIGRLMNPNSTRLPVFPAYTASIDAAMTLVPEDWRLSRLEGKEGGESSAVIAKRFSLFQRKTYENGGQVVVQSAAADAATPAIALCIAALKATQ